MAKLTPEQIEIIRRAENGELHIDVPKMPVERLPGMPKRERIDFVHISHPNHDIPMSDI